MVGGGGRGGGGEVIGAGGHGKVVVVGRAEIDTRAPFRSVKEAVVLFGERVLAGELSSGRRPPLPVTEHTRSTAQNRVAATRPNNHAVSIATAAVTTATPRAVPVPPVVVTAELEEAKQKLEKEREEKQRMAGCIQTLQEELNHAMRELKRLKARDDEEAAGAKVIDLEIDDGLHFTEAAEKQQPAAPRRSADGIAAAAAGGEFQKKRYVTFADPPTVTATAAAACRAPPLPDVVMELHRAPSQPQPHYYREPRFQRQMSAGHEAAKAMPEEGRKKKKKPLIPLVGALFMRRKKNSSSCHDDVAF